VDGAKKARCDRLGEREHRVSKKFDEYDGRLGDGEVSFAVIKTKLNLILGILAAIGGCMIPIFLNMAFK